MGKTFPPQGLPSDYPAVLVFAVNHARPSFIKTVAEWAVLRRPSRLRPEDTSILKGRENSLSVMFILEFEIRSPHCPKIGIWDLVALFDTALAVLPQPRASETIMADPIASKREIPAVIADFRNALAKERRWYADIFGSEPEF